MRLHNESTVPVELERAWDVLHDLEQVAPCLPGSALLGSDGSEYQGEMTIKHGPVLLSGPGPDRAGRRAGASRGDAGPGARRSRGRHRRIIHP
ncbi:MAG: hypothetical protein JO027_02700 [Solirubrobacterales bacterium]|nr:hypothetical protein [Solirubrobacterales bacterium]